MSACKRRALLVVLALSSLLISTRANATVLDCTGIPNGTSCAGGCVASGFCQSNVCVPMTNFMDGFPCDSGDICSELDTCIAGICTAGPPLTCTSADPCMAGVCLTGVGCTFTNICDFAPVLDFSIPPDLTMMIPPPDLSHPPDLFTPIDLSMSPPPPDFSVPPPPPDFSIPPPPPDFSVPPPPPDFSIPPPPPDFSGMVPPPDLLVPHDLSVPPTDLAIHDLSGGMPLPDLSGGVVPDLFGVPPSDLAAPPPPDFAGLDLSGVDMTGLGPIDMAAPPTDLFGVDLPPPADMFGRDMTAMDASLVGHVRGTTLGDGGCACSVDSKTPRANDYFLLITTACLLAYVRRRRRI